MSVSRAIGFVLLGWAALIVGASLRLALPWARVPVPELTLLVVLYLGLTGRGAASVHLVLALVLGYLGDLFAGAPRGLHALSLGVIMLGAHGASSGLLVVSRWQVVAVTLLGSVVHGVLLAALAAPTAAGSLGASVGDPTMLDRLRPLPGSALATALLAPFVFRLCAGIDRRLWPVPRGLGIGLGIGTRRG